jgi:hypothetical protein
MYQLDQRQKLWFIFMLLIAFLSSPCTYAQAKKTADRSVEFDTFGGLTYLDNDYYAPYDNFGVTLGVDYTQFIKRYHGLITPSFQIRGTITPGSADSQKTLEGGLKLATTYRRLHPYGDFQVGLGIITFPLPPNPVPDAVYRIRDSSVIYVYGGGITYDIRRNWSIMLDYQQQHWDLGSKRPNPPDRLTPKAATVGVVFHIPFKVYKTR